MEQRSVTMSRTAPKFDAVSHGALMVDVINASFTMQTAFTSSTRQTLFEVSGGETIDSIENEANGVTRQGNFPT